MANPNNLVRPPILNAPTPNPSHPPNQSNRPEPGQINLTDLRNIILEIVNSQLPHVLQATNPNVI